MAKKKSTKTAAKKPKQSEAIRTLKKRKYCDEYAKTGVMLGSCEIVDIHHTTLAKWKEEDPEFREACELAKQVYIERLEKEVDRRAFEGQRRLKFDKNGLVQRDENGDVYEEWNFNSNLAMFRLKRLDPGYRERHEVTMSDAKLNEEIQRLLDERGGNA